MCKLGLFAAHEVVIKCCKWSIGIGWYNQPWSQKTTTYLYVLKCSKTQRNCVKNWCNNVFVYCQKHSWQLRMFFLNPHNEFVVLSSIYQSLLHVYCNHCAKNTQTGLVRNYLSCESIIWLFSYNQIIIFTIHRHNWFANWHNIISDIPSIRSSWKTTT